MQEENIQRDVDVSARKRGAAVGGGAVADDYDQNLNGGEYSDDEFDMGESNNS